MMPTALLLLGLVKMTKIGYFSTEIAKFFVFFPTLAQQKGLFLT